MTTDAERIALLIHVLITTRRIGAAGRRVSNLADDMMDSAEWVIMLGNRLDKALRKADEIGAWFGPFDAVRPMAESCRVSWAGLVRLRNAYEHEEDRVANFRHADKGAPTGERPVLGIDIPTFSGDGLIGNAEGPETIWFLQREYDVRPAMTAIGELRAALAAILVDERGHLRSEPVASVHA